MIYYQITEKYKLKFSRFFQYSYKEALNFKLFAANLLHYK